MINSNTYFCLIVVSQCMIVILLNAGVSFYSFRPLAGCHHVSMGLVFHCFQQGVRQSKLVIVFE